MLICITTFYNTNLDVKEKDYEDHREERKVIFKIIEFNFQRRSTSVFSGNFSWDRSILS